jgi:hypothetical protein
MTARGEMVKAAGQAASGHMYRMRRLATTTSAGSAHAAIVPR